MNTNCLTKEGKLVYIGDKLINQEGTIFTCGYTRVNTNSNGAFDSFYLISDNKQYNLGIDAAKEMVHAWSSSL